MSELEEATQIAVGALLHFDNHGAAWTILTLDNFDNQVAIRGISSLEGKPAPFGQVISKVRGTE